MPSKVTKKEIAASSLAIDGNSVQTSETTQVTQPGVDAISTEAINSGRGKRKRNVKDEVENSIDQESPEKPKRSKKVKIKAGAQVTSPTEATSKKVRRGAKTEIKEEITVNESEDLKNTLEIPTKANKKTKAKVKKENVDIDGEEAKHHTQEEPETPKKPKKKRKTKEEKEAEAMPLAARTTGLKMFVGAHVSGAKGVHNSITNCAHIGGNAFALFLKSQRKWENPPLQDEHRDQFRALCLEHKYDAKSHILPHGSYLVNLAQEDPEKATQAYNAFVDDLRRCEILGIRLYNFHPGWTGPTATRPSALSRIAKALNRALSTTKTVVPVLETMAGAGGVIGNTFQDLAGIIAEVDDKSRIGVCLDTCHVFAAGYDLREPDKFKAVMQEFDDVVGLKYLKALHLNDSKAPFNSHRDLHANIGTGFLGLRAFHNIMNEKRFENLPMVLETPIDKKDPENEAKTIEDKWIWAREIKLLEELIGMDTESEDFKQREGLLSKQGREERAKHLEQYERKIEKDAKVAAKGTKKSSKASEKGKQTTLAFAKGRNVNKKERDKSESDDLSSPPTSPEP